MMEALQSVGRALTLSDVVHGFQLGYFLTRLLDVEKGWTQAFITSGFSVRRDGTKILGFWGLYLGARCWLNLVNEHVPEPYLDEVFHIPQAQKYCDGHFWDWDDKITTPPGLYLLSLAYHKLRLWPQCTAASLRSTNVVATMLTALLAVQCRHLIEVRAAERERGPKLDGPSSYSFHTGINIATMPVIFFFSALYYTDVFSTLVVLVAYRNHLLRLGTEAPGALNGLWTVILGGAALFMRQTNVFWVVVYMGGCEAVHALRWPDRSVHDPPLNESGPVDWLSCALSVVVNVLIYPARVLRQIWPHVTILGLFVGFVAWNGGVVLGDKSNHIATIHLPQLLYIWPFSAFFSAPLLLRSAFLLVTHPITYLQNLTGLTSRCRALINIPHILLTTLASLLAVRYNTLVHPFTLADNRHYMFYVFRRTILRGPVVRSALVVPYTLARWLVWDQLSGSATAATATAAKGAAAAAVPVSISALPPRTSTALLWLLATSLSLVTAPLVEPRYFILPWVFYRLLVPKWSVGDALSALSTTPSDGKKKERQNQKANTRESRFWDRVKDSDVRLVVERVWLAVVNVATIYVFLWKVFVWRGPEGEVLDGGRTQRFMW